MNYIKAHSSVAYIASTMLCNCRLPLGVRETSLTLRSRFPEKRTW